MIRKIPILAIPVLVVTAGCLGGFGGGGGPVDSPPSVSDVPADADMIASFDTGITSDAATKAVIDTYFKEAVPEDSDQPRSLDEAIREAENQTAETNLSFSAMSGATMFARIPSMEDRSPFGGAASGEQYVGVLIRTTWSESDVVDTVENDADVTESTYKETTIYTPKSGGGGMTSDTPGAFAKYGENLWVFGTEAAVKDVIDVSVGDTDSVSGEIKDVYESTRSDGYVRYAVTVPEELREQMGDGAPGGGGMGFGAGARAFQNVTAVSGSYYSEGGQEGSIGMNVKMEMTNEDVAETMQTQVDSLIGLGKSQVGNETIKNQLDSITVEREGTTVTVNYESAVADLQTLIRQFVSPTMGTPGPIGGPVGSSGTESTETGTEMPKVRFDWDYDASSGTVTAVHAGGDLIDGDNLRAMCGPSSLSVPSGEIQAGNPVVETSECDPGDTVRLVWESPSGDTTRVIAQYTIPSSQVVGPIAG